MSDNYAFISKGWFPFATSIGAFVFQAIAFFPAIYLFGAPYGSPHFLKFDHPVLIGLFCIPLVSILGLVSSVRLMKKKETDAAFWGFLLNGLYLVVFIFLVLVGFGIIHERRSDPVDHHSQHRGADAPLVPAPIDDLKVGALVSSRSEAPRCPSSSVLRRAHIPISGRAYPSIALAAW